MTLIASPPTISAVPPLVLHGVSWSTYVALREETDAAGQHVYLTYDNGKLEIMPVYPLHEKIKMRVHDLIIILCDESRTDIEPLGSTTWKREAIAKGLEPDQCYFIAHAAHAREEDFDPTAGPPPDLALEIDITSHSIARQPIYASLGVPELWRYDASGMEFLALEQSGEYSRISHSTAFPMVTSVELRSLLDQTLALPHMEFRQAVREWVRIRLRRE